MELVPREDYPDYYALIKRPMAFDIVQVRLNFIARLQSLR
jgi:hypothetical protein